MNKAFRNKVVKEGTIAGYRVAAVDGTKLFGSNKKSCDKCLKSRRHDYHSGVVMSLIKDEGEITASKRLISRVSKQFNGKSGVIVYDALACNSIWIQLLELKK